MPRALARETIARCTAQAGACPLVGDSPSSARAWQQPLRTPRTSSSTARWSEGPESALSTCCCGQGLARAVLLVPEAHNCPARAACTLQQHLMPGGLLHTLRHTGQATGYRVPLKRITNDKRRVYCVRMVGSERIKGQYTAWMESCWSWMQHALSGCQGCGPNRIVLTGHGLPCAAATAICI